MYVLFSPKHIDITRTRLTRHAEELMEKNVVIEHRGFVVCFENPNETVDL